VIALFEVDGLSIWLGLISAPILGFVVAGLWYGGAELRERHALSPTVPGKSLEEGYYWALVGFGSAVLFAPLATYGIWVDRPLFLAIGVLAAGVFSAVAFLLWRWHLVTMSEDRKQKD
jgi:hypothetical protein